MARPPLRRGLTALLAAWPLAACAGATHEVPGALPVPVVDIARTQVPTSGPSPTLPPPPAGVPDAIVDSRWARHPDMSARTDEWVRYWSEEGRSNFQIYLDRMERYRLVVEQSPRT